LELAGVHHVTAISARIRDNYRFYTGVLGMRLVKRSVNQDDVRAYHLFYADAVGTPGTNLTFFDWGVPPESRGTNGIVRTHLRVNGSDSLEWWADHLSEHGLAHEELRERDGRATLDFEDREGQRLALVDDGGLGDPPVPWEDSSVPIAHQIRGLGPIVLSVPNLTETDAILTGVMALRPVREYSDAAGNITNVQVYEMGSGGPSAEVHVAVQPELPVTGQGAGGVHHVAFRTRTEDEYHAWGERLNRLKVPNSGKIDRFWFRSLYFREPNGILFEIATDGPGFTVDERADSLGEAVVLPPFLEPHRERILADLKPID